MIEVFTQAVDFFVDTVIVLNYDDLPDIRLKLEITAVTLVSAFTV